MSQQPEVISKRTPLRTPEIGSPLQRAWTDNTSHTHEELISISNRRAQDATIDRQSRCRASSEFVPAERSPDRATCCALDATDAGFRSLEQPAQSLETRKQLHERYQLAMCELRHNLPKSRPPVLSICRLALYEVSETDCKQLNQLTAMR